MRTASTALCSSRHTLFISHCACAQAQRSSLLCASCNAESESERGVLTCRAYCVLSLFACELVHVHVHALIQPQTVFRGLNSGVTQAGITQAPARAVRWADHLHRYECASAPSPHGGGGPAIASVGKAFPKIADNRCCPGIHVLFDWEKQVETTPGMVDDHDGVLGSRAAKTHTVESVSRH